MNLLKRIAWISLASMGLSACVVTDSKTSATGAQSEIEFSEERPVRYRKNVDKLTAEELAAYEHAVTMMKKKSQQNIYDRTGFLWQAWVHNCTNVKVNKDRQLAVNDIFEVDSCNLSSLFSQGEETHREHPGMCEHAKDTFLQWHRAEFYFYEQALQDADPQGLYGPSTKDVMVPYWNFTKNPSGIRYPKAFEDPSSPLFDGNRATGDPGELPYTSPELLAYLLYTNDWPTFGGYPAGGGGNYGTFEAQIHNPMHDRYVAGYLQSPTTAGLDPIFYSFHAYIDYIFEKWIDIHGTESITSGRFFARGEQSDQLLMPVGFEEGSGAKRKPGDYTKNMGRGEIYFDTRKQGYAYLPGAGGEFLTEDKLNAFVGSAYKNGFGVTEKSLYARLLGQGLRQSAPRPQAVYSSEIDFSGHGSSVKRAMLDIIRKPSMDDYSFQADVYLTPKGVNLNVSDRAFRDRYLAVSVSYWYLLDHHDHHEGMDMPLVMTQDISDVVDGILSGPQSKRDWQLTIALSGEYAGDYLFENPKINFE